MPTPPAVPNLIRFRLWFDLGSGYQGGVGQYMSYSGTTPAPPADMEAYCDQAMSAFSTNLASFMSTAYSLTKITARALDAGGGEATSTHAAVPGTDSNTSLPVDVAALVNQKIVRVFRGGKSRVYWPFGTEPSLADNHTWTDAFVSALAAAVAAFSTAAWNTRPSGGAVIPGGQQSISLYGGFVATENPVTKRYRNIPQYRGVLPTFPVIPPDAIVGFSVQKYLASQRRRVRATGA